MFHKKKGSLVNDFRKVGFFRKCCKERALG